MSEISSKVEALNALSAFLPRFEEKGEDGGQDEKSLFLIRDKDVEEFVEAVEYYYFYLGQDSSYKGSHKIIFDQNSIADASYQHLLLMLRISFRLERMRPGTMKSLLERGDIQAILRKLVISGSNNGCG